MRQGLNQYPNRRIWSEQDGAESVVLLAAVSIALLTNEG